MSEVNNETISLFDELYEGLNQPIDFVSGAGEARVTVYDIAPVKRYTKSEIKQILNNHKLSQRLFANYMGVSIKTVEAWENGKNYPTG